MLAAILSGLALAAGPADEQPYAVTNVFPRPGCNSHTARAVELDRITSHPKDYLDQCVSVAGYFTFRALFTARSDAERRYSNADERSAKRRIGLYMSDADRRRTDIDDVVRATAVGTVSHCDCLQGPNVFMVLGYCHQSGGPILAVAEIKLLD
jgi:hypothetical protein